MSLVIEGEHLHMLCLIMCNPIGYFIIKLCTLLNKIFELKLKLEETCLKDIIYNSFYFKNGR